MQLLTGCKAEDENPAHLLQANAAFKLSSDAERFISMINNQPDQLMEFNSVLKDNDVCYEQIKLMHNSADGMHFVIPVSNSYGQITGAIYYPIKSSIAVNGLVKFDSYPLHNPRLVTSEIINNEIPITHRFLYSHMFESLSAKGLEVDTALMRYEFLNDSIISVPVSYTTKRKAPSLLNRYLEVDINYEESYVGSLNGSINALSVETAKEIIKSALYDVGVGYFNCEIEHLPYNFTVRIPLEAIESGPYRVYKGFVNLLCNNIINEALKRKFNFMIIQYHYFAFDRGKLIDEGKEEGSEVSNPSNQGGGYSGGGYSGGGHSDDTNNDNTDKIPKDFPSVTEIAESPIVKKTMEEAWGKMINNASEKGRREYGFFIYYDFKTKKYTVGPMVEGPNIVGFCGTSANVYLGVPTDNLKVCAFFHTHTTLEYCHEDGYRPTGPSDADVNYASALGLPGLLYDYAQSQISCGDDKKLPHIIYTFGPSKRIFK